MPATTVRHSRASLLRVSGSRVHVFADDALGTRDATGVAAAIRDGEISALDAVDAAIARAERLAARVEAIAYADFEAARARAAAIRPNGAFSGVPTFVKDNVDVRGLPTNHGTRAYAGRRATVDDAIARQYLAQGVIPLGKSKLPEFGFNASTEYAEDPPTANPWDPAYSAGASSGGSAALVAAGAVPIAHANDGGGSIRIPAAACGLVGLKPSRGRVLATRSSRSLPLRIVSDGVLTRTVRDTAGFLAAAERYRRNRALPPIGRVDGPASTRLRIGVLLDSPTGHPTDDETRAAVRRAADELADLGHDVTPLRPPVTGQFVEDFTLYWGMLAFLVASTGRWALGRDFDRTRLDNLSTGLRRMFGRSATRVPPALYRLRRSTRLYQQSFTDHDVVMSPVLSHTTPELGHLSPRQPFERLLDRLQRYVGFTPLNNTAGGPAMSLPLGRTATGLPIGVHFSAPIGAERRLLALAYEIEQAHPFPTITSPGADSGAP
jgi:amidase